MAEITDNGLIEKASSVIKPRKIMHGFTVGDVGCALLTDKGNVYLGVCMDVSSGIGFCAEHAAIAAMVTHGEHRIKKIVAVWKDKKGTAHIVPPCGRCREFMRQIHKDNLKAYVIVGKDKTVRLKELLPFSWD